MMLYLVAYITTAVIFLAIDFVWLGFVAGPYYKQEIGDILLDDPKMGVAALFYLIYAVGIVIFAVKPALESDNYQTALIYGALFGFFCYATYDATNLATIKNWPAHISIMDTLWGTFVSGTAATLGYLATKNILPHVS